MTLHFFLLFRSSVVFLLSHHYTEWLYKPVIYIHTSGTGVLIEDVRGKKGSSTVYHDLNPDQINGLPDEQIHRDVDLFVIIDLWNRDGIVQSHFDSTTNSDSCCSETR